MGAISCWLFESSRIGRWFLESLMTRRTTAGSKPLMSDYFSIITFWCHIDFLPGAMTTFGVSFEYFRPSLSSKIQATTMLKLTGTLRSLKWRDRWKFKWSYWAGTFFETWKTKLSRLSSMIGLPRPVFQPLTNSSWKDRSPTSSVHIPRCPFFIGRRQHKWSPSRS